MSWVDLNLADLVGSFLGLVFTLSVFSYILGDNALFRLAIHILIGVAAGLTAAVTLRNVIVPQLFLPLLSGSPAERLLAIVPLVLSGLILMKSIKRLTILGSPVMAFLVGVGAAAAVGGGIIGTLFPQVSTSVNLFNFQAASQSGLDWLAQLFNAGIVLVGTVTTFAYFHFGTRTHHNLSSHDFSLRNSISWIGQAFIAITFGVLYAGILGAALSALIERLSFLWTFILPLISPTF